MPTGEHRDRRSVLGIGVAVAFVGVVATAIVTGVGQQIGSQLYNSRCWGTVAGLQLGKCSGSTSNAEGSSRPEPTAFGPEEP